MNFFGFSSPAEPTATEQDQSAPMDGASYNDAMLEQQKFHALDELKRAGVPLKHHVSPYLQVDPSIFKQSQPEYIMPEGYENGRGRFEFALGHIGCAVGGGFMVGGFRGFSGELFNHDTRKLAWKPWFTRVLNASGKHGSGYAQMAGTGVFLYSAVEVLLKSVRADDPINSFVAGAVAGGLYRSPYGARAAAVGTAAGFALSALWNVGSPEQRERLRDMLHFAMRGEVRDDLKSENMADEGVSVERQQELLLINKMAATGKLPPKSQSGFLQKKLQQRKFFDSGDYAMNQNKEKKQPPGVNLPQATAAAVPVLGQKLDQASAGAKPHVLQAATATQEATPASVAGGVTGAATECALPTISTSAPEGAGGATADSDDEECHLQIPRPDTVPQRKASILHPSVHSKLSPQPHIHHDKSDELISSPPE